MSSSLRAGRVAVGAWVVVLAIVAAPASAVNLVLKDVQVDTSRAGHGVLAEDLDGDGDVDIAVANPGNAMVSIYHNGGTGQFSPAGTVDVATQPTDLAKGDFNGDGRVDLAVTSFQGSAVSVLSGQPGGAFTVTETMFVNAAAGIAARDFNGDGHLDLAAVSANLNRVEIFHGAGNGTFSPSGTLPTQTRPNRIAAGDLNGDGRDDLVATNLPSGTVSVYVNGPFGLQPAGTVGVGDEPVTPVLADVNGDGVLDLLTSDAASGTVSILLGTGTGAFGPRAEKNVGGRPYGLAAADANGDGHLDVLATNSQAGQVFALFGAGDGSFPDTLTLPAPGFALSADPRDLSGDGDVDFALSGGHGVSALLNWPAIAVDPTSITFDTVGTEDPDTQSRDLKIENTARGVLEVGTLSIEGPDAALFELADDGCSRTSLRGGESCSLRVLARAPESSGEKRAWVVVPSNDLGGAKRVPLSLTALGPAIAVSPEEINFGLVGTDDPNTRSREVTVENRGRGLLHVGTLSIEDTDAELFELVNDGCSGATLKFGAECTVTVVARAPSTVGDKHGSLVIPSNDPFGPREIPLALTAIAPAIAVSPTSITFDKVGTGQPGTQSREVTVKNEAAGLLRVGNLGLGGPDAELFELAEDGCSGAALALDESCTFDVVARAPDSSGEKSAFVAIPSNDPNGEQQVALSLTAEGPAIDVDPESISFGRVAAGSSGTQSRGLSIGNTAMGVLNLAALSIEGPDADLFTLADDGCSRTSVSGGGSCTVNIVARAPATSGERSASVIIRSNDPGGAVTVPLSLTAHGLFTCRAVGVRSGSTERAVANGPQVPCVSDHAVDGLTVSGLRALGLDAVTEQQPVLPFTDPLSPEDGARSSATAQAVTFTAGSVVVDAVGLSASASSTCGEGLGSASEVRSLRINGTPVPAGRSSARIKLVGVGTLHVNATLSNRYGVVRRALWFESSQGSHRDVVAAEAAAGTDGGDPCI